MNLHRVFAEIDQFQYAMGYDYIKMTKDEKLAYARQCGLALHQEVAELCDSFQFAEWKKPHTDYANIEREVIDVIFFLHHICRCFNISVAALEERFVSVMENNYMRYGNGKRDLE